MADLIDREKTRAHCLEFFPECSNVVDLVIDKEPTVDAVEVVRCKDCARASEKDGIFMCGYFGCWMDPYEFCSQGERKE